MDSIQFSFCLLICLFVFNNVLADTKVHLENPAEYVEYMLKGPLVNIRSGSLRGSYVNVKGVDTAVHTYLGVPFAKPPVGPLRLAPPVPIDLWEGERDATQQPPMCMQERKFSQDLLEQNSLHMDVPQVSEDYLYLNIYTPATSTADSKLPVMVWIHGGSFVIGSASSSDGSALAAYQDVVLVAVQYRLGILGFFSTGDEQAPGNLGLQDQVAALRWVQENIQSFDGDPGSVTIFGESAGGTSVSLLLLSPMSSGLFHRAIAQSGTANMKHLVNPNQFPVAQIVANMSGCDITNSKTIKKCMMQLTDEEMAKLIEQARTIRFMLSIDGQFLTKSAEEYLENHEVHKVPFMTGVTNQEFGWVLPNMLAPPGWVEGMDRDQIMNLLSFFYLKPTEQKMKELIVEEYLGKGEDRVANRDIGLEVIGDILLTIPTIQVASYHRDAGVPVYLYELQESPSILKVKRPSFVKADHGDDIMFVFGHCFTKGNYTIDATLKGLCTDEEEELERTMMAYWANFARTGSPNGAGLTEWPQYGVEEEYLGLGTKRQIGKRLKGNRYVFLTQTLPRKIRDLQKERKEL